MHSPTAQQEFPLAPELLARLLQWLSQSDILTSCSLVSRGWSAAAASAAAATGIEAQTDGSSGQRQQDNSRVESVCCWLAKHGRQLTGLGWKSDFHLAVTASPLKVCLPYSQLCQLRYMDLTNTHFVHHPAAAPAASGSSSTSVAATAACGCASGCPLAALTSLTFLSLHSSGICEGGLCCLSALRALRVLHLLAVSAADVIAAMPGLVQLPQLTEIRLVYATGTAGDVVPLPFSSFQHLDMLILRYSPAFSFRQLPSSLTNFGLSFCADEPQFGRLVVSSTTIPSIPSLTALQQLDLTGVKEVDPAVLAGMRQLQCVELEVAQFSVQSLAALLAALPRLQQLRRLEVQRCVPLRDGLPQPEPGSSAVDWRQLPAALCLQHLSSLVFSGMCWPAGVGQHIFAPGWQFPALGRLELSCSEGGGADQGSAAPLGSGDLARLASCCPALDQLNLNQALQPGVDLLSLAQLRSLTHLILGGEAIGDAAGHELGQLTQLAWLWIHSAPEMTDAGLLCLTRLTGLQQLYVHDTSLSEELDPEGWLVLNSKAAAPDVWQQLESKCRASSVCRELMLLEMRDRQLAEQAAGGMQQQQALLQGQVAALQQQNALLQQQNASLQQQVCLLQQQNGVQQQQHALLQQRMAALEQQLGSNAS